LRPNSHTSMAYRKVLSDLFDSPVSLHINASMAIRAGCCYCCILLLMMTIAGRTLTDGCSGRRYIAASHTRHPVTTVCSVDHLAVNSFSTVQANCTDFLRSSLFAIVCGPGRAVRRFVCLLV